ncbi:MAG: DUF1573 domain-containing protein [Elusimicrobiota bacterium]
MQKNIFVLIILLITCTTVNAQPKVRLSDVSWDFGIQSQKSVLEKKVVVINRGTEPLTANFQVTCDCMEVLPQSVEVPPSEKRGVLFKFNTRDYNGNQNRVVYVETNDPEVGTVSFSVTGSISIGSSKVSNKSVKDKLNSIIETGNQKVVKEKDAIPVLHAYLFGSTNCKICLEIEKRVIKELQEKYGVQIKLSVFHLDNPDGFEKLRMLEKRFGTKNSKVPVLFMGTDVFYGKEDILTNFPVAVEKYKLSAVSTMIDTSTVLTGEAKDDILKQYRQFGIWPVIAAGILDGINPCAFAVIVFFVTYLIFFLNRTKTDVLFTGITFILGVFFAYLLMGIGLGKIIGKAVQLVFLAKIFYIGTGIVMAVFSVLSFRDAVVVAKLNKVQENAGGAVTAGDDALALQLPGFVKKWIHNVIRKQAKLKGFVFIAFFTGFIVSFLEFACTGQIYLPIILYILKVSSINSGMQLNATMLLVLYNIMFIMPLLLVFVMIYFGVTSEKVRKVGFQYMPVVKVCIGVLFIFFSVYMLWSGIKM